MSEWGKSIGSALGGAVAGPFGALVGGILGSTIDSVMPSAKDVTTDVLAGLGSDGLTRVVEYGYRQFQSPEVIQVNHDLQNAFRDALRTAIYDIGGSDCFPKEWAQARRQTPREVLYPMAALRHRDPVLADQVCRSLNEFGAAVEELLPLTAPSADATAINPYLLSDSTDGLERAFWQQVVAPFLARHPAPPEEAASFEAHLRQQLLPRTLVHLSENLKERPEAWRAFNRLMLETIRQTLAVAEANDANTRQELAAIRAQLASLVVPDSEQLANLIGELGETRRQQDERFDQLLNRVTRQHREVLGEIRIVRESVIDAETRLSQKIAELRTIQVTSSEIQDLPPLPGEAPYKGLLAYEQADEAIYFGRRELANNLAQSLHERTFVAVVGASGSGKSSLVRAGTLPILMRQGWRIFEMTPTTQPLDKLAQTLYPQNNNQRQRLRREMNEDTNALVEASARLVAAAPARRGVLVVDQFEELFTQAQDEGAKRAFVAALLPLRDHRAFSVVIVLRSDFYHRCADYEGLLSAVAESQVALEALSERQLLELIGQPLVRNGWRIQEGLAQAIIEDVGKESGGLPFLAHALRETWERRRHNVLTLSGYQEAGGVKGAITESAEAAWQVFNAQEQSAARTILIELTEVGEREGDQLLTPDTRRRRSYGALAQLAIAPATLDAVLEQLVRRRLLIRDQEHIEVAHEALIRAWPRLQQWLNADHARLRVARQIEAEANRWEKEGRDPSYLARGVRLAQASEWAAAQPQFPVGLIGEFLRASIDAEEFERNRELEQAQKLAAEQSRRARTFRWAAILTTVLLLFAVAAAAWALDRQGAAVESANAEATSAAQAQAESTRAAQEANSANAARATADANANEANMARATADANAAEARVAQAQAESAARTAQSRALAAAAQAEANGNPMRAWLLAIEAGRRADTEQAFSAINAHAVEMAQPLTTVTHKSIISGILWNQDESRILSWSYDDTLRVWEAESGELLLTLNHADVLDAFWNKDESRILSYGSDTTVRLWDAETGELLRTLPHDDSVWGAVWNEDESRIASWSFDGFVRLWDAESGEVLLTLAHEGFVNGVMWNQDESRILSWASDHTLRVWDAVSGELLLTLSHDDDVYGASWNADESRILSWGNDNYARMWDAESGEALFTLAHDATVYRALWNDDESRILSWSWENIVRVWDGENGELLFTLAHDGDVDGALWNQDGSRILSWSDDHTIRIWDLERGELLLILTHNDSVNGAMWNQDESRILSWSNDNSARLWDMDSGALLLILAYDGDVYDAVWNEDESRILAQGNDDSAHVWRAENGAFLPTFAHDDNVRDAVWNSDESRILSRSDDNTVRVWDAASSTLLFTLPHDGVSGILWNDDGRRFLSWGSDNFIRLWDAERGELLNIFIHWGAVYDASWFDEGRRMLSWGADDTIYLWDVESGDVLLNLAHGEINGASWNDDESRILSWSLDNTIRAWDGEDGELLFTFAHNDIAKGAIWNEDESRILSWSWDGTARVWDGEDGELLFTLAHDDDINGAIWNEDESRILSWGWDRTINVWDANDGSLLLTLVHDDTVWGAAWDKNESRIFSWASDNTLRLWDATSGALLRTLTHDGTVLDALWSNDERRILSWGTDNYVRVWDVESGERLRSIPGDGSLINSVQWSHAENQIMLTTQDGYIYRYYNDMAELIEVACTRATRNLTQSEWQQYLPGEPYQQTCSNLPVYAGVPEEETAQ